MHVLPASRAGPAAFDDAGGEVRVPSCLAKHRVNRHQFAARVYRHYHVIHVICDNARFHTAKGSKLVREYLEKWGHRIVLHYLPSYSPDANPIERVWWRMHERVTRNHRCLDLDGLLDLVFQWLQEQKTFSTESRFYPNAKAA